jgi:hypothetical protein
VVKENLIPALRQSRHVHASARRRSACCSTCSNLSARHAGEPREEIIHPSAPFKILEKRPDRDARAVEQPFAADFSRYAFNRRTFTPIEHRSILRGTTVTHKVTCEGTSYHKECAGFLAGEPCREKAFHKWLNGLLAGTGGEGSEDVAWIELQTIA